MTGSPASGEAATGTVVHLRGVIKDYRGLRPLRVAQLELRQAESIALLGFDQVAAEVLVDLITGTTVPDEGEVTIFGQPTSAIPHAHAWLESLDRFALLSDRAVLVDRFTAEQNLTLPFSLNLESISDDLQARVLRLAAEVGLSPAELTEPTGNLPPMARARVRLGRALALDPQVLLAEHPNATLSADDTVTFATDLSRIVAARGMAALVMTADRGFATAAAPRVLALQAATGALTPATGWRRWFA